MRMVEGKRASIGGRESLRRPKRRRVQHYYDNWDGDYVYREQDRDDRQRLYISPS